MLNVQPSFSHVCLLFVCWMGLTGPFLFHITDTYKILVSPSLSFPYSFSMAVPDTQQNIHEEDDSSQVVPYNPAYLTTTRTLLPSNIANFITAISLATRLSLRFSALFMEALFEAAKYSTVFSIGLSRQALISAISTAKKVHALTYQKDDSDLTETEKYEKRYLSHLWSDTHVKLEVDSFKSWTNTLLLGYILFIILSHWLSYLLFLVFS